MDTEPNERFDEMLDEITEPYKIGYLTFPASKVLRLCDPIAYRVEVSDFESNLEEEEQEEN